LIVSFNKNSIYFEVLIYYQEYKWYILFVLIKMNSQSKTYRAFIYHCSALWNITWWNSFSYMFLKIRSIKCHHWNPISLRYFLHDTLCFGMKYFSRVNNAYLWTQDHRWEYEFYFLSGLVCKKGDGIGWCEWRDVVTLM
jgi:hypothetical protein